VRCVLEDGRGYEEEGARVPPTLETDSSKLEQPCVVVAERH
jgi:hypothetical protein